MREKKILVVDDETLARDRIRRFLRELSIEAQIHEAQNGVQALEKIRTENFDLVFLDIQMPGLTGFEVLQNLEVRSFQLIFQTAYDEYALKAFEESACDYLLKPFSLERFKKALGKVFDSRAQASSLQNLEAKVQEDKGPLDKLLIKQSGKTKVIDLALVECFVSRDHYTCISVGGSELISDLSLNWLEERIDPEKFIRLHRNNIVAIEQIKSIGGTDDSEVELKSGAKLPLSRNNRKRVLELFASHK